VLSYLSDGDESQIQALLQTPILPVMLSYFTRFPNNRQLWIPTIRVIGNISSGNDAQTEMLISSGFLDYALTLLNNKSTNIQKDTCWALSNVCAGSSDQIDAVIRKEPDGGLLSALIQIADKAKWEIRKEAAWSLANIVTNGTDKHQKYFVHLGGFSPLVNLLIGTEDSTMLLVALDSLQKLLELSKAGNMEWELLFDELGGVERCESLQQHKNDQVYNASIKILESFFSVDAMEEQNLVPACTDEIYSFGLPPKQLFSDGSPTSEPMNFNFGGAASVNAPFTHSSLRAGIDV
jgi:hypothetical protein